MGGSIVEQYKSFIIVLLPIALGVVGLIWAVNFGISFFRDIAMGGAGYSGGMNEWQERASGVTGWYDEDDIYHEITNEDSYNSYMDWSNSIEDDEDHSWMLEELQAEYDEYGFIGDHDDLEVYDETYRDNYWMD